MLAFKYIYGLAPQYLSSLLTVREYSRYNLRSTDGVVLVDLSVRTKKTLGNRAFSTAAPKVWNNLPLHIRNEKNFDTFNKLLKNCYFKIAYNLVTWTYFNIFKTFSTYFSLRILIAFILYFKLCGIYIVYIIIFINFNSLSCNAHLTEIFLLICAIYMISIIVIIIQIIFTI